MNTETTTPSRELFYDSLIASYIAAPGFVDRPWLAQKVNMALADPDCRFLLLTAEPGAGKTTFMAWLASQNPAWPRYFIRRDSKAPLSSGDARSFLFTIGHQLAARRPALFRPEKLEVYVRQEIADLAASGRAVGIQVEDLEVSPFFQTALRVEQHVQLAAGELIGVSVKHLTLQPRLGETGNLQFLALIDPARALLADSPAERIVILVNALDELRYLSSGESVVDWLAGCPELPANVRLVLTSRSDPALLDGFRQSQAHWLRELTIHAGRTEVEDDLRRCSQIMVAQEKIGAALAGAGLQVREFADRAVAVSKGNFQYLAALFRNLEQILEQGDQESIARALALEAFPAGLGELYAFYVRQVRRTVWEMSVEVHGARPLDVAYLPAWEGLYQPILGVLSVARKSLDLSQLQALGQPEVERRWFSGAMGRLGQFLKRHGGGFRLYHNSFIDFLTAAQTELAYPDCYLDPREWHMRIVGRYLADYESNWSECDTYGLTYLVDHVVGAGLAEADRTAVLDRILTNAFIEAVLERAGWLFSFVEDLEILASVEPERASQLCMNLILDASPNSLVIQRCLRLMVRQRPSIGSPAIFTTARQRAVNSVVEILSASPSEAPDLLVTLLKRETDPRVRGVIALALAETGDVRVSPQLLELLSRERLEGSWAAADALIALNDRSVIPELIRFYESLQSKNDRRSAADKERILYILGWMHAEEAQALKRNAWASRSAKIIGRGVDLTWLLRPVAEDGVLLLERLQAIVTSAPQHPASLGSWADEWVQKRLVRALTGLGVTAALPDMERLLAHIALRPQPRDLAKRRRLVEAAEVGIAELETRM